MSAPISGSQFYQAHPNVHPHLEGMRTRCITECVLRLLCNFWRSAASYFQKISLDSDTKSTVSARQGAEPILKELTHKRTVGPSTINDYTTTCLPAVQIETNFMMMHGNLNLPDPDQKKDLLFFPTVVRSGVRDHIVAIVYDKKNNRVELYDPKGLVALDRMDYVRNQTEGLMLINVIQRIVHKYGDENTTIWENTTRHQYDSHNCGIYVLDYVQRRSEGRDPAEIATSGLSFSSVNNSIRRQFLDAYLTQAPQPANVGFAQVAEGDDF
ncbi:MAG: hypothetical protein S4CHLAM2_01830 [Chlamydiales bacterium]|nr:hypothetical protein [Chlamydiales bacterium]